MQKQAKVLPLIAGLLFTLASSASHAADLASFTLVRAQIERAGTDEDDGDVVEQKFGIAFAEVGDTGWYSKARSGFGNSGAYAIATDNREAFGEAWWVDAFTVTGGLGHGELTLAIRVSGTITGEGRVNYGLFTRQQKYTEDELRVWLDSGIPDPPAGSLAVVPLTWSFPTSGNTVLTARIPFTYDQPFHLASYFGAETWGEGVADFYGSAHFGITAPADGLIVTASGAQYLAAAAVPEPVSAALMALGLVAVLLARRRADPT